MEPERKLEALCLCLTADTSNGKKCPKCSARTFDQCEDRIARERERHFARKGPVRRGFNQRGAY